MSVRVSVVAGLMMALIAGRAGAAEPESAWARAGAPLSASGAFDHSTPLVPNPILADHNSVAFTRDGGGILDEVRVGALGFFQQNSGSEQGLYITAQVLFDPFVQPFDRWYWNVLLRPRPHIGGNASPWGTDQLFAGLTWTLPIGRLFFAEASFGGTVHDGPLTNAQVALGCRFLFRESLAAGFNINAHWRVVAGIDHSSHAELCGQENDGLTHIGASLGYKF